MPAPDPHWLTPLETCRYLGRSQSWLKRHRCHFVTAEVPGRGKTGREHRFQRASVEKWMNERKRHGRSLQELLEEANRKSLRDSA